MRHAPEAVPGYVANLERADALAEKNGNLGRDNGYEHDDDDRKGSETCDEAK